MDNESSRTIQPQIYEHLAEICKAFANPRRMEIIEILSQGEHTVEAVARETDLSVANTSQHLQLLRTARLVTVRRSGVQAYYQIADPAVFEVIKAIQHFAERLSPEFNHLVATLFPNRNDPPPIALQELAGRIGSASTLIIDIRPLSEYQSGHIPGAVSVPLKELPEQIASFAPSQEIIAYDRGEYSSLTYNAVKLLRKAGFNARRLEGGYPEWKFAGYPTQNAA